jgi:hypothetical protein
MTTKAPWAALEENGYATFTYNPTVRFLRLSADAHIPRTLRVCLVDGDIGACVVIADGVTIARRSGQAAPWVSVKPGYTVKSDPDDTTVTVIYKHEAVQ